MRADTHLKRLMRSNISPCETSGYFFCRRMDCIACEGGRDWVECGMKGSTGDRGLRVNNALPGELPFRTGRPSCCALTPTNIAPMLRSISPKEPNRKRRSEASADQPLSFISQDSGYVQRLGLAVGMTSHMLVAQYRTNACAYGFTHKQYRTRETSQVT